MCALTTSITERVKHANNLEDIRLQRQILKAERAHSAEMSRINQEYVEIIQELRAQKYNEMRRDVRRQIRREESRKSKSRTKPETDELHQTDPCQRERDPVQPEVTITPATASSNAVHQSSLVAFRLNSQHRRKSIGSFSRTTDLTEDKAYDNADVPEDVCDEVEKRITKRYIGGTIKFDVAPETEECRKKRVADDNAKLAKLKFAQQTKIYGGALNRTEEFLGSKSLSRRSLFEPKLSREEVRLMEYIRSHQKRVMSAPSTVRKLTATSRR